MIKYLSKDNDEKTWMYMIELINGKRKFSYASSIYVNDDGDLFLHDGAITVGVFRNWDNVIICDYPDEEKNIEDEHSF